MLTVTCTLSGTEADAPRAAIQQDGLHVHIRNTSGADRLFDVEGVGGDSAPSVEGFQVWRVPTGTARFNCGPPGADPVAVEIVDPAGYYVSDTLDCPSATRGSIDYGAGTAGQKGDVLVVARGQIGGLRAGDRVERAGYPRADQPSVRVVRDGKTVAVAGYDPDGAGGWLLSGTSVCDGTGLTWGS